MVTFLRSGGLSEMTINKRVLRNADCIGEDTINLHSRYYLSKDYQRDKEYFSLDYSDIKYREVHLTEEEF